MRRLCTLALALLLAALPAAALAQPPVAAFYGNVTVDGSTAPTGTSVKAYIGGSLAGQTTVTANGSYSLSITEETPGQYAGKTVSFNVADATAAETAIWRSGEVSRVNLSSVVTVQQALSTVAPKLVRVWGYDAAAGWKFYDPQAPAVSQLQSLDRGKGYWLKVTEATTLTFGSNTYSLSTGWNLIGWLGP